jgi:hypothetical protein
MSFVRFLLWSTLAPIVAVAGVMLGTGVAGAVIGPAAEARFAAPSSSEIDACPVEVHHEVGYDAAQQTYALRAVDVSAPSCPAGTTVSVAIDGRTIGQSTLGETGIARVELSETLPAAGVTNLQVLTAS